MPHRTVGTSSIGTRSRSTTTAAPIHGRAVTGTARMLQLQRLVGNRAVMQLLRASSHSPLSAQDGVIQRHPSYRLPKEDNSEEYDTYEERSIPSSDLKTVKGDTGTFTSVHADIGMPTYYGALKRIFGSSNLHIHKFNKTQQSLDTKADRPRSVSANIDIKQKKQKSRVNSSLATAIGHLGSEQLDIQEGEGVDRDIVFNGGHLVGYQVLGGVNADQAWNIAPQDEDNNKFAYNHTIEEMARKATKGSNIDYTVELSYPSPNFEVDQIQLYKHGYLKHIDDTKPWTVQLPTRIPQHWSAKAVMNNNNQSFGRPTEYDPDRKTYGQYSQELTSELSHTDRTRTARYNLTYENSDNETISEKDVTRKLAQIRSVHYRMYQEQPFNIDKLQMPENWKGGEKSDLGSVEQEQLTFELVLKLRKDIEQEISQLEDMSEDSEHAFDLNNNLQIELNNVNGNDCLERVALFGALMHIKLGNTNKLQEIHNNYNNKRKLVDTQMKQLLPTKLYIRKKRRSTIVSETSQENIAQETGELRTHNTIIKRAKRVFYQYKRALRERKEEENRINMHMIDSREKAMGENYRTLLNEKKIRQHVHSLFSTYASNLRVKGIKYYQEIVKDMCRNFPPIPDNAPLRLRHFIETEDEDSE